MNEISKKRHFEKGEQLARKMSALELISQMMHSSRSIKRLGIERYNWWNESLHGVARAGIATVFPQAICMAASFDAKRLFNVAEIISTEARAKFNDSQRKKDFGPYKGLTMWSPNINIYRDPRWGRGQETYGEDPFLTGLLGAAFIAGLQGDDPEYIKTAACAKHFAVHSGPEATRHEFNSVASKKDMLETYLPAFKKAVTEAKVCGIMGAYNRTNGEACCASETLLEKLLRGEWGFDGYFVSDCGALPDIVYHHHLTKNPLRGGAMAVNAGCDLECGVFYRMLPLSLAMKYVKKEALRKSVTRLMAVRSSLGMFDADCPYNKISPDENARPEHEAFAVETAEKGIVMLENNGVLPIKKDAQKILVTGYNAENNLAYLGNYFGDPTRFIKVTEAVKEKNSETEYAQGYSYNLKENPAMQAEALKKAESADLILLCTGLDCSLEGEEAGEMLQGGGGNLGKQGDRLSLGLPPVQLELFEKLIVTGKNVIVLNFSGGAIDLRPFKNRAEAVLQCWYPGAQGGKAIANILFGEASPSGKLPLTFYNDISDLPDFEDYSMKNRTYRYFKGEVQYPFGFGRTYTDFELINCEADGKNIRCTVKNTGDFECDEVLQLYLTCPETEYENPIRSLIAVKRFSLLPNEEKKIIFEPADKDFYSVNESGDTVYLKGDYILTVSDGQSIKSNEMFYTNRAETEVIENCPI